MRLGLVVLLFLLVKAHDSSFEEVESSSSSSAQPPHRPQTLPLSASSWDPTKNISQRQFVDYWLKDREICKRKGKVAFGNLGERPVENIRALIATEGVSDEVKEAIKDQDGDDGGSDGRAHLENVRRVGMLAMKNRRHTHKVLSRWAVGQKMLELLDEFDLADDGNTPLLWIERNLAVVADSLPVVCKAEESHVDFPKHLRRLSNRLMELEQLFVLAQTLKRRRSDRTACPMLLNLRTINDACQAAKLNGQELMRDAELHLIPDDTPALAYLAVPAACALRFLFINHFDACHERCFLRNNFRASTEDECLISSNIRAQLAQAGMRSALSAVRQLESSDDAGLDGNTPVAQDRGLQISPLRDIGDADGDMGGWWLSLKWWQ